MVCANLLYMRAVDCFCISCKGSLPVESWHFTCKRGAFAKDVDYFCNDDKLNIKSTRNASPL